MDTKPAFIYCKHFFIHPRFDAFKANRPNPHLIHIRKIIVGADILLRSQMGDNVVPAAHLHEVSRHKLFFIADIKNINVCKKSSRSLSLFFFCCRVPNLFFVVWHARGEKSPPSTTGCNWLCAVYALECSREAKVFFKHQQLMMKVSLLILKHTLPCFMCTAFSTNTFGTNSIVCPPSPHGPINLHFSAVNFNLI